MKALRIFLRPHSFPDTSDAAACLNLALVQSQDSAPYNSGIVVYRADGHRATRYATVRYGRECCKGCLGHPCGVTNNDDELLYLVRLSEVSFTKAKIS